MGKGGRTGEGRQGEEKKGNQNNNVHRVPHEKPPFTLGEIKKAIPPHCFNRSLIRSFSYLMYDLSVCFILSYLATNYIPLLPKPLAYLAWTTYACVQGCFMHGLWILAHECGHNAFTDYYWLNDTVGFILHSVLLVPYFSFKFSHHRHHANSGSLDLDETHVPRFKETLRPYNFKNPVGRIFNIVMTLSLGLPLYWLVNINGRSYDRFVSHFYPYSPIFSKHERVRVLLSDLGFLAAGYGLYRIAAVKGLSWLLLVYGAPLLALNGLFIVVTIMHHTHPSLPRYDSSEWDWLRGALNTVDRDYGILNKVLHNITDTHVIHHLFSTMPHYHAKEATQAIKPILGDYYLYDTTPFYKAFWREVRECFYVEADEGEDTSKGVYWFKNKL